MTTTFVPTPTGAISESPSVRRTHLVRTGTVAALAAGTAATATAGVAYAAGERFVVGGSRIPIPGFAQVTIVAVALGAVIAAVLQRWARHPRRTFLVTTLALTVLSFGPDVLADAHTGTKLTLMLTHLVAAAIAIPLLAARLSD